MEGPKHGELKSENAKETPAHQGKAAAAREEAHE